MPQFRPFWWINLISWMLVIFTFLIWYNQNVNFPHLLKILLSRLSILYIR